MDSWVNQQVIGSIRQSAGLAPPVGLISPVGDNSQASAYTGARPSTYALLNQYSYWNYIAISIKATRCAAVRPIVAKGTRKKTGKSKQGFRDFSTSERLHIRNSYPWIMQKFEDLQPVEADHPLQRLLEDVNPQDCYQEFVTELFLFWELCGEFYLWVIPSGLTMQTGYRLPSQLWVIQNQQVSREIADPNTGLVAKYLLNTPGSLEGSREIDALDIIKGIHKSPFSKRTGFSFVQAAPLWNRNQTSVESARSQTFTNGINPDVFFALDRETYGHGDLAVKTLDLIREQIEQRHGGRFSGAIPLPPGVTPHKLSHSPREMDFASSSDQIRDQVLALHGVPKTVAGITDDVNRATVEGANVVFCENVINPRLSLLGGILTEKLARRYGDDLVIYFPCCTPESADHELKEQSADFQFGALTPNERRALRGREPMRGPAYESGYIPSSVLPLSEELQQPPAGDNGGDGSKGGSSDGSGDDNEDGGDGGTQSFRETAGSTYP